MTHKTQSALALSGSHTPSILNAAVVALAAVLLAWPIDAQAQADPFIDGPPLDGSRLIRFEYNGFDINVYEVATNSRPGGFPTDSDRQVLLAPICAFLRDPLTGRVRFRRLQGPRGFEFFEVPIVVKDPGAPHKAAAELRRVKGWDIDPQDILWMELTAITVTPEHGQLFGEGIKAEIGRQGNINLRNIDVVTFPVRLSGADDFERALVEGHNFIFEYEARYMDPDICAIEIRAKDIRDFNFSREIKGPGGERFVSRAQVLDMLHSVISNMSTIMWLDPDVRDDVVERLVERSFNTLKDNFWRERAFPQREYSLTEFFALMVDPDGADFQADLMTKMATDFHTKDEHYLLDKYREEIRSYLKRYNESSSSSESGGSGSFFGLIDLGGSHKRARSSKSDYVDEDELLLDTLREVKDNVEKTFHFEKEGEFYIPK